VSGNIKKGKGKKHGCARCSDSSQVSKANEQGTNISEPRPLSISLLHTHIYQNDTRNALCFSAEICILS
jgi:hypothetical protein